MKWKSSSGRVPIHELVGNLSISTDAAGFAILDDSCTMAEEVSHIVDGGRNLGRSAASNLDCLQTVTENLMSSVDDLIDCVGGSGSSAGRPPERNGMHFDGTQSL